MLPGFNASPLTPDRREDLVTVFGGGDGKGDMRVRRGPPSGLYHGLAPAFLERGFVEVARRRPDRPLMRLAL